MYDNEAAVGTALATSGLKRADLPPLISEVVQAENALYRLTSEEKRRLLERVFFKVLQTRE